MNIVTKLFGKSAQSFGSITEALKDYWIKNEERLKAQGLSLEGLSPQILPKEEYGSTPFSVPIPGTSKWTETLSDYQDYLSKHEYDNYGQ